MSMHKWFVAAALVAMLAGCGRAPAPSPAPAPKAAAKEDTHAGEDLLKLGELVSHRFLALLAALIDLVHPGVERAGAHEGV